jgi:hypothetical protein
MNGHLLTASEASALESKQKHWARIRERLAQRKSLTGPTPPTFRSILNYPLGRFEHVDHVRLEWIRPNWFEFIPKKKNLLRSFDQIESA